MSTYYPHSKSFNDLMAILNRADTETAQTPFNPNIRDYWDDVIVPTPLEANLISPTGEDLGPVEAFRLDRYSR